MVSDSLGPMSFEDMLDAAKSAGVEGIEINSANWTSASYCYLAGLKCELSGSARWRTRRRRTGLHGLNSPRTGKRTGSFLSLTPLGENRERKRSKHQELVEKFPEN